MRSDETAIKVENISKVYRIGLKEQMHDSFGTVLFNFIKSPLSNYLRYRSLYRFDDINPESNSNSTDIIWALKNVSFEVKQGEAIGIIGSNGAGKSTLLKILSKITDPTKGKAEIHGRVASLLEVGTGFHQELTGRENVYLNGTILGMRKNEVDRKYDEIVDFSGLEKFIDTPVKRYSSGMRVRLAFAVAAHLDPEILLVDEVLAVGDAAFQKKCMSKMENVTKKGRTVFLVSHNMGAVTQLCERALWLENGQLKLDSFSSDVVRSYLSEGSTGNAVWNSSSDTPDDIEVKIKCVRILSHDNKLSSIVDVDKPFKVEILYEIFRSIVDLSVTYHLYNSEGILLFESMDTDMPEWRGKTRQPGQYTARCTLNGHLLKPGRYYISVASFIERVKIFEYIERVLTFDVSELGYSLNPGRKGIVTPVFEWDITQIG